MFWFGSGYEVFMRSVLVLHAWFSFMFFQSVVGFSSCCLGAVQPAEPGQRDPSVGVDVAVGALVHALHQVLLVQQRVVGAQRAGSVIETLVVMAELRLPL